jgi:glycosyltransferase involved in cell wall biosynthesis
VRVSVVVCEHSIDRYEDLQEAVESLLKQTYDDTEIVLVSDGNTTVCEQLHEDYGNRETVVVHCLDENRGLLGARNTGAEVASGDVVAFIDDDAIADEHWVEELAEVYETKDVPAAGGKMTPAWVAGKPEFLPEEFYWLVGVTHRGFGPNGDAELAGEVRNTFGSNISFRRDVFLDLGGFDTAIGGRKGDANLQGGETELCARLSEEYGYGVYYNPQAEVAHKVFEYRTKLGWLLDRAFWQGYSKRGMEMLVPESSEEESDFLGRLLNDFLPGRLGELLLSPSKAKASQLCFLSVLTTVVGIGYLYGFTKYPPRS